MKIFFVIFMVLISNELTTCEILLNLPQDMEKVSKALNEAFKLTDFDTVNIIVDAKLLEVGENCVLIENVKSLITITENVTEKVKTLVNILLFDDESSFETFLPKLTDKNFKLDGFFLLNFRNQTFVNQSRIFEEFWKLQVSNVNILSATNDIIEMSTFLPFTESECHGVAPVVINSFQNDAWTRRVIFPKKLIDLNGCSIKLSTFDYPPAIIIEKVDGVEKYSGHDIELIQGLSQALNFNLEVNILHEPAAWGFILDNGTSSGVMKEVMDKKVDIAVGVYYLTKTRANFMSFGQYTFVKVVLVIPPGVPFSPFEKLLSPFTFSAWVALLATFLAAILLIYLIRTRKISVQQFVFGSQSENAYLNMFNILMNGGQHLLPQKNFARTMFMMFVLFCIVIRTSYQAALFKFLQTDQKHEELKTIDELIQKNFDIYMYASFQELSRGLKIHQR